MCKYVIFLFLGGGFGFGRGCCRGEREFGVCVFMMFQCQWMSMGQGQCCESTFFNVR